MDPVTLTAAATLIGGVSALQGSLYQSAVARSNAAQAELDATQANEVGQLQAQDASQENAGLLGQQVAEQGASGLALDSPSSVRGRKFTRKLGIEDQRRIVEGANRQSARFRTEANNSRAESKAHRTSGLLNFASSAAGAYGSYLGGAQSTRSSPSFIPAPRSRNRFYKRAS